MLKNKKAIVTGASGGMGRAIALELAKKGVDVALASLGRGKYTLHAVADLIREEGREALIVPTDITKQKDLDNLTKQVLNKWGKIDILVSNAGIIEQGVNIAQEKIEVFEEMMRVNFFGSIRLVHNVLPHLLKQNSGHIVLIVSMTARLAAVKLAAYTCSKFALRGYGDCLRRELYNTNINVTSVYPSITVTKMSEPLEWPSNLKISMAEEVAEAIVEGVIRKDPEVIYPRSHKFFYFLNFFSPRIADWIINNSKRINREME